MLKTSNHQSSPNPASRNEPADDIERAIFDLQDVKNCYEVEQKEFEKIEEAAAARTQEGFFKANRAQDKSRPMTQGGHAAGKLKDVQGELMNDPDIGLYGEMDQLSNQDLKERLIVAEKVMKSLFQRNRELEDKAAAEQRTTTSTNEAVPSSMNIEKNDELKVELQELR